MFSIGKFIGSKDRTASQSNGITTSLDELIIAQKDAHGILTSSAHKVHNIGAGGFRSPFKGRGMEFDEVREYKEGDDIRTIDWKVTAKTGKTFTKLFHEERERPVFILVDMRPSMKFGTKVAFKSVIAAKVAALLVWSAKEAGDKIGGIVFSSAQYTRLKPHKQRRRMLGFLNAIAEASTDSGIEEGASLAEAIGEMRRVSHLGGLVFIISDFHDFNDEVKKQLTLISSRSDLVCIYIEDKLEKYAPPSGVYRINNGKAKSLTVNTADMRWRKEYEATFATRKSSVENFCSARNCIFINVHTDDEIAPTLRKGIHKKRSKHYAA